MQPGEIEFAPFLNAEARKAQDSEDASNLLGAEQSHFLRGLREHRQRRNAAFSVGMEVFSHASKSTDPWLKTMITLEGRAFEHVLIPWLIINLFSVGWNMLNTFKVVDVDLQHLQSGYVFLMPTLGFLLVFRLNRIAVRFWDSRQFWGIIVAAARSTAGLAVAHLSHSPSERDNCLAWTCAFCVGSKHLLRKATPESAPLLSDQLAGVLSESQARRLAQATHPGLFAAQRIREAVHRALQPGAGRPAECAPYDAAAMQAMAEQINQMVLMMGGCERVQGTPLPLAYVTHLRSCLFVALLGMPLLLVEPMGWSSVATVAVISFAFLGIDGAATDCETPFNLQVNHLNMDAFCRAVIDHIEGIAAEADAAE